MKRYKLTFTEKQINYILRGLTFFEDMDDEKQEKYAFELYDKILKKIEEEE